MECISVFDMLKIGVGPSSSHTLGPWRAAELFLKELKQQNIFDRVQTVSIELYGSLSLTGIGHATDLAVMLGLSGADPEYVPVESIQSIIDTIKNTNEYSVATVHQHAYLYDRLLFSHLLCDRTTRYILYRYLTMEQ